LRKTASSIREQTYDNIQWIIADGASIDSTLDVINENIDIVSFWFSEPDAGIYDAWNKACNFIDGAWTIFLGAGDTFQTSDTLQDCCNKIMRIPLNYDFAFGNIKILGKHGCHEIVYEGEFCPVRLDLNYSTPAHSSTFTRSFVLKNNRFETRLKIIADSKFMITHSGGKYYNLKTNVTVMDGLGISHNVNNIPQIWKESLLIYKDSTRAPFLHIVKVYIVNYRNIFLLRLIGAKNYSRWMLR